MEYTVGSVADLISGKNTPNKPNVIKRKLPQPQADPANAKTSGIDNSPAKTKIKDSNAAKPLGKGTKAPFKKEKKPLFNNKNKKIGKFVPNRSFNEGTTVNFKKANKNSFNKKINRDITSNSDETDLTVIDHKVIEKLDKQESKNTQDDENEFDDSEDSDDNAESAANEDGNNKDQPWQNPSVKKELDSRTLFVGNIAVTVTKKKLIKLFGKFGKVEAVRLRGVTPSDPGVSKRVAVIKKMFHPKRTTLHCYIRFEKREDALKALELNGTTYKDHRLRVQMSDDSEKPAASKAIFVGNLPFDVEDDDLWTAFETFGSIKSVRVIRNAGTGMGIGIGYVNFESSDSVEFALQMEDVTIKKKVVRIQRCNDKSKKTRKVRRHERRKRADTSEAQENPRPKQKLNNKPSKKVVNEENSLKNKDEKTFSKKVEGVGKSKWLSNKFKEDRSNSVNIKNSIFQGSKSDKKKQKPKLNKGFIQKLKLSQKIAPRPTKQ